MTTKISVLMIDGAEEQNIALSIARCLNQVPEIDLHVLANKKISALRVSRLSKSYTFRETKTDERWISAIKEAATRYRADILLAAMEPGANLIGTYRDELQKIAAIPPTPDPAILESIIDKKMLAKLMRSHNIPIPKTIVYADNNAFQQQLDGITFPVLFKPNYGGGGWGIVFFNTREELDAYLTNIPDYSGLLDRPVDLQFLIQEYIPGHDMGCSILAANGEVRAITIQQKFLSRPNPFEPSAGVKFVENDSIVSLATRVAQVTNLSGVAHIDLRYDERDESIKLIEINARYWQSLLGSLKMGVNFPQLAIYTGMNIPFEKPTYLQGRFIDMKGALKDSKQLRQQMINRVSCKKNMPMFSISETDINFALTDPIAEITRFFTKN